MQTCIIWPRWCHCHSLSLASVKSRLVLPFWYRLTRAVPDKGPLNGCVCVCVSRPRNLYDNNSSTLVQTRLSSQKDINQKAANECWKACLNIVKLQPECCTKPTVVHVVENDSDAQDSWSYAVYASLSSSLSACHSELLLCHNNTTLHSEMLVSRPVWSQTKRFWYHHWLHSVILFNISLSWYATKITEQHVKGIWHCEAASSPRIDRSIVLSRWHQ